MPELARLMAAARRTTELKGLRFVIRIGSLESEASRIPRRRSDDLRLNPAIANRQGTTWVKDPVRGVCLPLGLDPGRRELIAQIRARPSTLRELDPRELKILLFSHILIERSLNRARADWRSRLEAARKELRQRGSALIRGWAPPALVLGLNDHYALLRRHGLMENHGAPDHKYVLYNDPVGRYYLKQFQRSVERSLGARVRPTYPFYYSYRRGSALKPHRDREQCHYSLALHLSDLRESSCGPWPLHIQDRGQSGEFRSLVQCPGDAAIFLGRDLTHYRDPAPRGLRKSSSILFHYVSPKFRGSLRIPAEGRLIRWGKPVGAL
jgi:hypothetical protein